MKYVSWNVNGLRAVVGKNFGETFAQLDADFFCLQETKMQAGARPVLPRLYLVLELRREEGLFRHCCLHAADSPECHLRHGHR